MRTILAPSLFLLSLCLPLVGQESIEATIAAADAAWQRQAWPAASASYRTVVDDDPLNGEAWHRLGYALHAQGKLEDALQAHVRLANFPRFAAHGAFNAACVHALQGRAVEAFACLDQAVAHGLGNVEQVRSDTDLVSLRKDKRFETVLAAVAKNAKTGRAQVFSDKSARKRQRLAWFGARTPGQISIEYGVVGWRDGIGKLVQSKRAIGRKWRLGASFWTSLDTSLGMTLGGVKVPAGYYYLTLEQREEQSFVHALHDAAAVRAQHLDPVFANKLQGGIEVPLTHRAGAALRAQLAIDVVLVGGQDTGELRIAFGPHRLSAKAKVAISL